MKQKKFLLGFIAGLLLGLVFMAVYASYRFGFMTQELSLLKDLNQGRLRQIENLQGVNNHLKSQMEALRPPVLSEEERNSYLQITKKIASGFTSFNEKNGSLIPYHNDELGFKMSYPASWGKLSVDIYSHANKPDLVAKGYEVSGHFEHGSVAIGAISSDYEDVGGGRGLSTAESVVWYTPQESQYFRKGEAKPDETKILNNNKEIAIWYGWPVGWETGDFVLAFRAPVRHASIQHIAFIGPVSNEEVATEDIEGFLEMARTFELLK